MEYLLLAGALGVAALFARKYVKQKAAIRLLADALGHRAKALAHTADLQDASESWRRLVKELDELLRELERLRQRSSGQLHQLEMTLGSLQEGVVVTDRDNYIVLVNKALCEIFPEMEARTGHRLESGMSSPEFLEFVRELKRGGENGRREVAFLNGSSERWMEVTAARLAESPDGKGPWYLFVLHDITQLKRLEMARQRFVANASHELKTPAAVIKGYAETLVEEHKTMEYGDRDRFLRTVHRHSERLTLLINDLLSLSRLENESVSFDWREADIFTWLRDLATEYRNGPRQPELPVSLELKEQAEAWVRFDALKLRQVFDNLLENASKYSPEGGGIDLGAERGAGEVRLWVRDHGTGVPEADLSRIFERFYRVDKGRSRETGGTGLGLSIVKHIVERHGGKVRAENAEGGGLRVVFSLPLAQKPEV